MLSDITPILITFNEAENIGRTLSRLRWAQDIVVVDSGSTDETLSIVGGFPQARIIHHPFETLARQWNFAVHETNVATTWILRLDADYMVSEVLIAEIGRLDAGTNISAYEIGFDYAIFSHPLIASIYPPKPVLLRLGRFRIEDRGHTEAWSIDGRVVALQARITHDDQKPLGRWLDNQRRYARLEAQHLLSNDGASPSWTARVRRLGWAAPILVFLYVLLVRGCIIDGWYGWYYALQRLLAETLIALEFADQRLRKKLSQSQRA